MRLIKLFFLALFIVFAFLITGCSTTVPVKQKFPDAPKELFEKCPNLNIIEPGKTAITDLLKTVVSNYALYYECSIKQEGWTDWYTEQKKIFDKVNEK
jgi:hypothetical protein